MAQAAFFSTIFLSTRIPGDKSRNFSFTAAAGVVGGATVIFLLRFAPRRMSVASSLIISSFALIVLAALPKGLYVSQLSQNQTGLVFEEKKTASF